MNAPTPLTKQQQLENCIVALWRWAETKPHKVVDRLGSWRCGTQACFGGFVAVWPEFQAQGVRAATPRMRYEFGVTPGAPIIARNGVFASEHDVADRLFGERQLFGSRGYVRIGKFDDAGHQGVTDHQLVARRLEAQIVVLSKAIEKGEA